MFRSLMLVTACAAFAAAGQKKEDPPKSKLTVELSGSIADESLMKKAPESGVIVSEKAWKELADAWSLKDPAKIDFTTELLVVAVTRGGQLNLKPSLVKGDLKTAAIATLDLRPGFRYAIKSHTREGVKTVNGKELPKE